jgi:predicted nucleotidyltransferase
MIKLNFNEIEELLCVMLFGSIARNDGDEHSDVDIFLLVDDIKQERINEIINYVKNKLSYENIGISIYKKSLYKELCLEGSMFFWHLKLEGKIIYIKNKFDLFSDLRSFTSFNKNLGTYERLYLQAKDSLIVNGSNIFDLSQLFFICRNLCLLTCFKLGEPTFGRISVFLKLVDLIKCFPLDYKTYNYLSKCRLIYTRGIGHKIQYPSEKEMKIILKQIDDLIKICRDIIEHGGYYEKIKKY